MVLEVLYTHDAKHPPTWVGRTIHPAVLQVVTEAHTLERCRRRMAEAVEAAGIHGAKLVEWQGVLLKET